MNEKELPNDGNYVNPKDAIKEYKEDEVFYVMIESEMGEEDIEYTQQACVELFNLKLPKEYIIEMLVRDSRISTEVFNRSLGDTNAKSKIYGYLALETLKTKWPIGATSNKDSEDFFEKFNQIAIKRKWRKVI